MCVCVCVCTHKVEPSAEQDKENESSYNGPDDGMDEQTPGLVHRRRKWCERELGLGERVGQPIDGTVRLIICGEM